jgi:hypothetical protein
MTAPLDEKGHDASTQALLNAFPMADKIAAMYAEVAIRAYLSAVALPDELEVAWDFSEIEHILDETFHFASTSPGAQENINHVLDILRREPLVRRSQAHSTIEALRAERDALARTIEANADGSRASLMARVIMESVERLAQVYAAEAEVERLTEDNEALRVALGSPDDTAISARFNRLYGICRRILWANASTPAIGNEQTNSALADLAKFLFADGIDAALSGSEKE